MVKIRLRRTGKRHQPFYRIVAADSASPRDGKFLEKIGVYDASTKPPKLTYDKALLDKWIKAGAQMTDTVSDAFVRAGVIKQTPLRKARISKMIEANKKAKEAKPATEETADQKTTQPAPKPAVQEPASKDSKEEAGKPQAPEAPEAPEAPAEKPEESPKETPKQ